MRSGANGYAGGFAEHYLMPVLDPEGLTWELQLTLGALALIVNVVIYCPMIRPGSSK